MFLCCRLNSNSNYWNDFGLLSRLNHFNSLEPLSWTVLLNDISDFSSEPKISNRPRLRSVQRLPYNSRYSLALFKVGVSENWMGSRNSKIYSHRCPFISSHSLTAVWYVRFSLLTISVWFTVHINRALRQTFIPPNRPVGVLSIKHWFEENRVVWYGQKNCFMVLLL